MGRVGELHKDFVQALAENKFRNRSVRIAKTATGPKLLHLGFLGAVLPQVEGLKTSAQFAGDGDLVDYGFDLPAVAGQESKGEKSFTPTKEKTMAKDEQIKKLTADLAAEKAARAEEKAEKDAADKKTKQAEFANFVETEMVAKGKLPKERKDEVVAFMTHLPSGENADFSVESEGGTKSFSLVDWFKDFVKESPAAEFTRALPAGSAKDFSRAGQNTKLVDLSHKV
jgi:hypothetical protein